MREGEDDREHDDERARRAILDLAKAEANLRHALLARSVEGIDEVAAAARALDEARAAFERAGHARPRMISGAPEGEAKSWGSH